MLEAVAFARGADVRCARTLPDESRTRIYQTHTEAQIDRAARSNQSHFLFNALTTIGC